ncbi:hypothetical protein C5Z25_09685 [Lactobacillus sp. CBA3605]|uniref:hypothetical protein n=1 Tax=Lactobacillus sp. CBA3605 TaxID=2099788 RepID=UPI000CFAC439|nr:hypothetical protein [Lactobacillus sp. CBA3605]AVK62026.1 hypothetical protein C5Z25_09685 [Lactobacillus sp. CBA3605]
MKKIKELKFSFSISITFLMVLLMIIYNLIWANGLAFHAVAFGVLFALIPTFIIALLVSFIIVTPILTNLFKIFPNLTSKIFFIRIFMMCMLMSLYASITVGAFWGDEKLSILISFIFILSRNIVAAPIFNRFFVLPFVKKVYGR